MLFLERTSPPPFFQPQLTEKQRVFYDRLFIGGRSQAYYLNRFAEFDAEGKLSAKWHWAAFFITLPWLLYRKRYIDALVYSVAGWSFVQLVITLVLVFCEFAVMPFLADAWHMPLRVAVAAIIFLAWSVFIARWADAYYYRMARREIADVIAGRYSDEQAAEHLRHEGGVSVVGMSVAFGLFAFALMVVQKQFLPLVAKQYEADILYQAYDVADSMRQRVDGLNAQRSAQSPSELVCPNVPTLKVSRENADYHVQVSNSAAGIPVSAQCVVVVDIAAVAWPNRELNGQRLMLYLEQGNKDKQWHCVSSLVKSQQIKQCVF